MFNLLLVMVLGGGVVPECIPAPRVEADFADLVWFPCRETVYQNYLFSLAYMERLEDYKRVYPELRLDEGFLAHCREAERLFHHWDLLDTATREEWVDDWQMQRRIDCLEELRELLSAEDWAQGRMPPAVPYWQFREVK